MTSHSARSSNTSFLILPLSKHIIVFLFPHTSLLRPDYSLAWFDNNGSTRQSLTKPCTNFSCIITSTSPYPLETPSSPWLDRRPSLLVYSAALARSSLSAGSLERQEGAAAGQGIRNTIWDRAMFDPRQKRKNRSLHATTIANL